MSSRTESYYDIYLFASDKRAAVTRIFENILMEIKQTLVTQKVSSYEAHGNVLIVFHQEWLSFVQILNTRERKVVLRPDGLFLALLELFPNEISQIYAANINVKTLLDKFNIHVNNIS
jgi:hypothetical protein